MVATCRIDDSSIKHLAIVSQVAGAHLHERLRQHFGAAVRYLVLAQVQLLLVQAATGSRYKKMIISIARNISPFRSNNSGRAVAIREIHCTIYDCKSRVM